MYCCVLLTLKHNGKSLFVVNVLFFPHNFSMNTPDLPVVFQALSAQGNMQQLQLPSNESGQKPPLSFARLYVAIYNVDVANKSVYNVPRKNLALPMKFSEEDKLFTESLDHNEILNLKQNIKIPFGKLNDYVNNVIFKPAMAESAATMAESAATMATTMQAATSILPPNLSETILMRYADVLAKISQKDSGENGENDGFSSKIHLQIDETQKSKEADEYPMEEALQCIKHYNFKQLYLMFKTTIRSAWKQVVSYKTFPIDVDCFFEPLQMLPHRKSYNEIINVITEDSVAKCVEAARHKQILSEQSIALTANDNIKIRVNNKISSRMLYGLYKALLPTIPIDVIVPSATATGKSVVDREEIVIIFNIFNDMLLASSRDFYNFYTTKATRAYKRNAKESAYAAANGEKIVGKNGKNDASAKLAAGTDANAAVMECNEKYNLYISTVSNMVKLMLQRTESDFAVNEAYGVAASVLFFSFTPLTTVLKRFIPVRFLNDLSFATTKDVLMERYKELCGFICGNAEETAKFKEEMQEEMQISGKNDLQETTATPDAAETTTEATHRFAKLLADLYLYLIGSKDDDEMYFDSYFRDKCINYVLTTFPFYFAVDNSKMIAAQFNKLVPTQQSRFALLKEVANCKPQEVIDQFEHHVATADIAKTIGINYYQLATMFANKYRKDGIDVITRFVTVLRNKSLALLMEFAIFLYDFDMMYKEVIAKIAQENFANNEESYKTFIAAINENSLTEFLTFAPQNFNATKQKNNKMLATIMPEIPNYLVNVCNYVKAQGTSVLPNVSNGYILTQLKDILQKVFAM